MYPVKKTSDSFFLFTLKCECFLSFNQPFVQAQVKENFKAPCHWPLWGEFTSDWGISHTQIANNAFFFFHLVTSSWYSISYQPVCGSLQRDRRLAARYSRLPLPQTNNTHSMFKSNGIFLKHNRADAYALSIDFKSYKRQCELFWNIYTKFDKISYSRHGSVTAESRACSKTRCKTEMRVSHKNEVSVSATSH